MRYKSFEDTGYCIEDAVNIYEIRGLDDDYEKLFEKKVGPCREFSRRRNDYHNFFIVHGLHGFPRIN